ncbi:MAG TPA: N-acetylmuramoyl-L-alanine amidase, partial [Acidimicrobiia bacterium]|nr:N-acetylmuramoyl-L-alanine amidase [Acidimicrobiia bacterium]
VGEQRGNGETYGAILRAGGAKAARVQTDRPIGRVTVLALADGTETTVPRTVEDSVAGASVPQPGITARSGWGADESLRFANGKEVWPPTFWPIQKLLVHHTATQNADPNPASTIRAIYYYHAITQGWGDIGYNFLIDEAGHVYKGRHSHTTSNPSSASPSPDDTITGEDASGNGVTAGHALGYNSGTMGVALLGTLTTQDATPAARNALADLLAWKADAHGIDPQGSSLYTNPVDGTQRTFPNIAGHRDVNATECPGGTFYATLPTVRSAVANRISASTTTTSTTTTTTTSTTTTTTAPAADTTPPSTPGTLAATSGTRRINLTWGASTDAGGGGLAGYEIFRSNSSGGPFTIIATTATKYNDGGLSRNRAYWYYVKAYDKAGNRSAPSNTATATSG